MNFKHISVLKEESVSGLNVLPDGIYVDCTTGGGGHSLEIAKLLTTGRLICFDKDTDIRYTEYPKGWMKKFFGVNAHCSWVAVSDEKFGKDIREWMFSKSLKHHNP